MGFVLWLAVFAAQDLVGFSGVAPVALVGAAWLLVAIEHLERRGVLRRRTTAALTWLGMSGWRPSRD